MQTTCLLWARDPDLFQQRLGAVTLKQNDDEAIELFEWSGIAVERGNSLADEISSLKTKYREAEETITKLNAQLEDLITAKNEHDDQLIAKFAKLLNEKKLKIRNQQRLLATANVNEATREYHCPSIASFVPSELTGFLI